MLAGSSAGDPLCHHRQGKLPTPWDAAGREVQPCGGGWKGGSDGLEESSKQQEEAGEGLHPTTALRNGALARDKEILLPPAEKTARG